MQETNPEVLLGESGVPGQGDWHVRWIVAGSGSFRIEYEAEKATNQAVEGEIR